MVRFFATIELIQLAVISSVLFSVRGDNVDVASQKEVSVRPDEEADLSCTTESKIRYCSFVNPAGEIFTIDPEIEYENRISFLGTDPTKDCGIKIKGVKESDNGVWTCKITAIINKAPVKGSNTINLSVLKAPTSVSLNVEPMMTVTYPDENGKRVRCTAAGGEPAPKFSWTLDGQPASGLSLDEAVLEDGSAYQEAVYVPKPEDHGKELACTAESQAYTANDYESKRNMAATKLDVQFPPKATKEVYDFYGMEMGKPFDIRISFRMNPAPTEMNWIMEDGTLIPMGSESVDAKYEAARFEEGPVDDTNLYTARLTINEVSNEDADKLNKLVVKNDLGVQEIKFRIAMGEKPPTEAATGPVVAVVVIILILIVVVAAFVVARSQGILCFAAADGAPDAEKGKFEALDKEDSTPEKETTQDMVKNEPAEVETKPLEKPAAEEKSPAEVPPPQTE